MSVRDKLANKVLNTTGLEGMIKTKGGNGDQSLKETGEEPGHSRAR